MSRLYHFKVAGILPAQEQILREMGVPPDKPVSERVRRLVQHARKLFAAHSEPVGLHREIGIEAFTPIFQGEGQNDDETPLEEIYPRAEKLALYALTMGAEVCGVIQALFKAGNFALGSILDTVASLSADGAVREYEQYFSREWRVNNESPRQVVLSYSPGYCGWHISGQKKLFRYLNPAQIGITLNDSYLMDPLKSVTGLLVAGPAEIHSFPARYPFCQSCREASCQERMKQIKEQKLVEERKAN